MGGGGGRESVCEIPRGCACFYVLAHIYSFTLREVRLTRFTVRNSRKNPNRCLLMFLQFLQFLHLLGVRHVEVCREILIIAASGKKRMTKKSLKL